MLILPNLSWNEKGSADGHQSNQKITRTELGDLNAASALNCSWTLDCSGFTHKPQQFQDHQADKLIITGVYTLWGDMSEQQCVWISPKSKK